MMITVPSQSDPTASYDVDLDALTCTCPHFARIAPKECKHFSQARMLAAERRDASAAPLEEIPGPTPAPTLADADAAFWRELMKADPDPDQLEVRQGLILAEQIQAERLVRAILTAERPGNPAGIQALKARSRADAQAWAELITAAETKVDTFRAMVLDWMQRSGVTKLQTPWFSAYPIKGRRSVLILDQEACIKACQQHYPKAVEMVPTIVKAEFNVAFDTFPKVFGEHEGELGAKVPAIAEEKFGEPSLGIRKK